MLDEEGGVAAGDAGVIEGEDGRGDGVGATNGGFRQIEGAREGRARRGAGAVRVGFSVEGRIDGHLDAKGGGGAR